jgi:hypothetical protein
MLPELMPAAIGLLCPDHGDTLRYRQAEGWATRAGCASPGCGYEVTA